MRLVLGITCSPCSCGCQPVLGTGGASLPGWAPSEGVGKLITFAFLVGELVVRQAKPPLLEILHSKSFPSLGPLNHESVTKGTWHSVKVLESGPELPPDT